MKILTQSYKNEGPVNKLVVSLNNAVDSRPIMADIAATGRSPHVLVDHTGAVHVLAEPSLACVPHQGQNLRAPHAESPALWVEFTGTGPDDIAHIDVTAILKSLCEQYGVPYEFPAVNDDLARSAFTATEGIVQRKSLRGYAQSTALPLPAVEAPAIAVAAPVEEEAYLPELDEVVDLESSAPAALDLLKVDRESVEIFAVEEETAEWPEFKGRPLKPGSKSEKIALLAEAHGLDAVEYDEDIEMLVTSTQEDAGLEVDGVIDAATWAALNPNK